MSGKPGSSCPAKVDEDDWHNVADAKQRKKIQDKLAQRARRKRLREARDHAKQSLPAPESQSRQNAQLTDYCHLISESAPGVVAAAPDALELIPYPGCSTPPPPPPAPSTHTPPPASLSHELPYPLTVFSALYINGQILGIPCRSVFAAKSSPASPDVPPPLQPTATQLLIVHFNVIDRFPFPKMRDNFINMSAIIDEEEFTGDLFTKPSFTIKAGATSWDPRAWMVEKPFADKWGFLFY